MAPLAAAARRAPARWPWVLGALLFAAALGVGWVQRPDGPPNPIPASRTAELAAEHRCLPLDRWNLWSSGGLSPDLPEPVGAIIGQTLPDRPAQVAYVPAAEAARWEDSGWQLRQWCLW